MTFEHKKESKLGIIIVTILFIFIFIWMAFFKIELIVKAPGIVIVKTYKKIVKHPKGGIVEKIFIKEGNFVNKNQNLIKIDTKLEQFKLNFFKIKLYQLNLEKKRLLSQLNNSPLQIDANNSYALLQKNIYQYQIKNLNEQINKINYQIKQKQYENKALKSKINSNKEILKTYKEELQEWNKLYKKNLIDKIKILDLERKIYNLKGDINTSKYQINKNLKNIKELQNQIKIIKSNYKNKILKRLNEIETEIPKLTSSIKELNDTIQKSYIKAPSSGYVTDLQIHSPNEVITPQKEIMFIVPKEHKFLIEAHISPTDIDKIKINEKTEIVFNSYVDPSAKPVYGKIIYVSADTIQDKKNPKIKYYKALIKITKDGLKAIKENHFKIVAGMPVTVFIHTQKVTILSYILYPIKQMIKGAFYAN